MTSEVPVRRPRVALVVPDYSLEGGLKSVATFLQGVLEDSPYDYTVISLATSSRDEASSQVRRPRSWLRGPQLHKRQDNGLVYWHVGCHFAEIEFMRYVPRLLLTQVLQEFDIVQMVAGSPAWGVAAWPVRRPVVLKTATLIRLERQAMLRGSRSPAQWWRRAMTRVTDLLDGLGLRRADAVVVVNEQMVTRLRALGRKVSYIPSGVDTWFFTPAASPAPRDCILSVGRLDDPRKNPALLLQAYHELLQRHPGAPDLILAGKTMPPPATLQLLDRLGIRSRVQLRPDLRLAELRELYRRASVFWLSSDEEGQGLVLVEAMACGVPVISTRSGGPESVIRDGVDGYLVPLSDAAAIAERTTRLLEPARWADFSRAARERAVEAYSQAVTGRAYLELYGRVLRASGETRAG